MHKLFNENQASQLFALCLEASQPHNRDAYRSAAIMAIGRLFLAPVPKAWLSPTCDFLESVKLADDKIVKNAVGFLIDKMAKNKTVLENNGRFKKAIQPFAKFGHGFLQEKTHQLSINMCKENLSAKEANRQWKLFFAMLTDVATGAYTLLDRRRYIDFASACLFYLEPQCDQLIELIDAFESAIADGEKALMEAIRELIFRLCEQKNLPSSKREAWIAILFGRGCLERKTEQLVFRALSNLLTLEEKIC